MWKITIAVFAVALFASGCAQSPKNMPCSNGGDCQKVDPTYAYCLEARCVQCVGDAACGVGELCIDGRCGKTCESDADCGGRVCDHKVCARD